MLFTSSDLRNTGAQLPIASCLASIIGTSICMLVSSSAKQAALCSPAFHFIAPHFATPVDFDKAITHKQTKHIANNTSLDFDWYLLDDVRPISLLRLSLQRFA